MSHRIKQIQHHSLIHEPTKINRNKTIEFKDVLQEKQNIKISKHAKQRLYERDIHIGEEEWRRIEGKILEAKNKGITDSLVIVNEAAMLVSVKNNTVVTAMDREEATSKIFTNINGAILLSE